ncbi:CBS domain-containing protein [Nocardia sp. alder85J]|nr:CBS domain-containing protein [Nocardia sp. alder85J]
MYARDISSRPVVTVGPQTPLPAAVSLITAHGFAAVPVVDDQGRVIGILSESDALGADPADEHTMVAAVMTTPVEVVSPNTDLASIARRMLTGRLRSMPVVEAGILVGIVARRDLLRTLLRPDHESESRVRSLLDDYAGSRRQWTVEVTEGRAVISGDFADLTESQVVSTLATTVEGIDHVDVIAASASHSRCTVTSLPEWMQRRTDEIVG